MKLLLDTPVFLWWQTGDPRLGDEAREVIAQASLVYVSAASAWEAALLTSAGKLRLPEPFERGVERSHFTRLPVTFAHAEAVAQLPVQEGHDDTVDRMLVAQAMVEGLALVTADPRFEAYRIQVIRAAEPSNV